MNYRIPSPNPNPTRFDVKPLYGLEIDEARSMSKRMKWELDNAEYYIFLFRPRDRKVVERFIPPPLKLVPKAPLVDIFVQQLTLNQGVGNESLNHGYLENIVGALVSYKGGVGLYAFAIHIGSDIGAMLGREMFGTAKKIGQFEYARRGKLFDWKVMRRGIPIVEASGEVLDDPCDPENAVKIISNPTYHLHQVIGSFDGPPYAYPPRLMEMRLKVRKVHGIRACDNVKMVYHESPFDPLCLVQPKEILAVSYLNADVKIEAVETLEELDRERMLPFLFSKFDPF